MPTLPTSCFCEKLICFFLAHLAPDAVKKSTRCPLLVICGVQFNEPAKILQRLVDDLAQKIPKKIISLLHPQLPYRDPPMLQTCS